MRNEVRAQSALEFISTYAWGLLILTIVVAVLLAFITLPSTSVPNQCSFTSTVTCVDFVLGSSAGKVTTMTINITNSQQYPILNPDLIVEVNGKNSSSAICTPADVNPGEALSCSLTLPVNTSLGTLLAGDLYLSIDNCALSSNYIGSGMQNACTSAPTETILGHYVGHTEVPYTITTGGLLYVSTFHSGTPFTPGNLLEISFVGTNSISVTNTIVTGAYFEQLVASPNHEYIYGLSASNQQTLYTISTQQNAVTNTLTLPGGTEVGDTLAVDFTGSYIYVCGENGDIWKVSTTTHEVVSTITALSGIFITSCSLSPSSTLLYVSGNSGSSPPSSFYTLSLSSDTVTNTISGLPGGCNYVIVAVVPNGSDAYTGCSSGMEIDLSTDTVVATGITIAGYAPTGTVFSSDSKYMYNGEGTQYDKMAVSNDVVVATVSGFNYLFGATLMNDGEYIALGDQNAGQVYVYNTTTNTKVANMIMPDGSAPAALVTT